MRPYEIRWSRSLYARWPLLIGAAVVLLAAPVLFTSPARAGAEKVQVCHVPPGNPSNRHTISVAPTGAEAHLANHVGDQLGACPSSCEDGTSCFDGNPCTIDGCIDGFCDFSQPVECEEGSVCTDNVCIVEQGGCVEVPANEGAECDDDVVCTDGDRCEAGVCVGDDIPACCRNDAGCNDFNACTEDLCDEATGVCSNPDVVCPEPGPCEVSICDADRGCVITPRECPDDGNLCTIEFCNTEEGRGCDFDTIECPIGEECNPDTGVCSPPPTTQITCICEFRDDEGDEIEIDHEAPIVCVEGDLTDVSACIDTGLSVCLFPCDDICDADRQCQDAGFDDNATQCDASIGCTVDP